MGFVSRGRIKVGANTMDRFSPDIMFLLFCSITLWEQEETHKLYTMEWNTGGEQEVK